MGGITDTAFDKIKDKELVIHPIGEDSVTPVGYDLRAGLILVLSHNNVLEEKDSKGDIIHIIPPYTSVLIRTREFVWLSENIMATIHSRGSLAAKCFFLNSTTVDPNWKGQMTCLLHNMNDYEVNLKENMRFATMVMYTADKPTSKGPVSNPTDVTENYLKKYDKKFSEKVANYLSSKEITDLNNHFNEMVGKARELDSLEILCESLKKIFKKIYDFVDKKIWITLLYLTLLIFLSILFITIYPVPLVKLGVINNINNFPFVARLAAFITVIGNIVAIIIVLYKSNND